MLTVWTLLRFNLVNVGFVHVRFSVHAAPLALGNQLSVWHPFHVPLLVLTFQTRHVRICTLSFCDDEVLPGFSTSDKLVT
jgi:hypothetical protein